MLELPLKHTWEAMKLAHETKANKVEGRPTTDKTRRGKKESQYVGRLSNQIKRGMRRMTARS